MPTLDRRRVLLILAIVVAVLGAALVLVYVRGADERAAEQFDTVAVLEATVPIEAGESIEDAAANGKVVLGEVAQTDLLSTAQTSIEPLAGLVALTTIYPGEQIITEKFGEKAAAPSPLQIPKGNVAISINLADPQRVAGFVNPGSEISIFFTPATKENVRVLLPRVTVLGVGSTTPAPATAPDPAADPAAQANVEQLPRTLMTLSVDQSQAEKVILGGDPAVGTLTFALLTPQSDIRPSPGTSVDNLFR